MNKDWLKELKETFNPTVKSFLDKYQDKTMLGFYWALLWRFAVVVYGTLFAFSIAMGFIRMILRLF